MALTHLCVILTIVPLAVVSQQQALDPCGALGARGITCQGGKVCRLVEVRCSTSPCPPQPICVDEPISVSDCRIGNPVVDGNNRPISCYTGRKCPDSTYCNTEVMDVRTTCCWSSAVTPTTVLPAYDPCTTQCGQGYHCERLQRPCAPPGPCPLISVCVIDRVVPTDKPGQCPVVSGNGICLHSCEDDSECAGNRKCCSNGCGTVCVNPVGVTPVTATLPPPYTTTTSSTSDYPCARVKCSSGMECRLRQVFCFIAPCPPQPTCVPVTPIPLEPRCPVGRPALDSNNKEFFCGRGPTRQPCPDGTFCNIHPTDRFAVCCHQTITLTPTTALPPYDPCIATTCLRGTICQAQQPTNCFAPPCRPIGVCVVPTTTNQPNGCATMQCRQGYHCEYLPTPCVPPGPCPLVPACVLTPTTALPPYDPCIATTCLRGTICQAQQPTNCFAPPCRPIGVCVVPTTTPLPNGCATMQCRQGYHCEYLPTPCAPPGPCPLVPVCIKDNDVTTSSTTTTPSTSDYPCTRVKCSSGMECRLRQVFCARSPCPPQPTCVPVSPIPVEPRCPVGRPALDSNNKEFFCGRGPTRQPCPDGTFCNIHPTDSFAVCCHQTITFATTTMNPNLHPCALIDCAPGYTCVEKTSPCLVPPCPVHGDCVATVTVAPVHHPCTLMLCSSGHRCVETPTKCSKPPCPLRGDCVPISSKPGQCPVSTGFGICVNRCSVDDDCDGDQKCCSNGCGRVCSSPVRITTTTTSSPTQGDPCANKRCGFRYECRVKQVRCIRYPCQPRPTCIRSSSIGGSRQLYCPVGKPVVNTRNRPISCRRDVHCPFSTYCFVGRFSSFTVCCPGVTATTAPPTSTPTPLIKNGRCPSTDGINGNCINTCRYDNSCPGAQKCCSNGCGQTCQNPLPPTRPFEKEGTCPSTGGLAGTCVDLCSNDGSCPGTQKCCSNGCGHTCQEPSGSGNNYAESDPCRRHACGRNQICRLQRVNCFRSPCPPTPTCVSSSSVTSSSRCRSGYSVLEMNLTPISCTNSRSVCPDSTVCSNGACCWDTNSNVISTTRPTPPAPSTQPPVTQRPGRCPRVPRITFLFFCNFFQPRCNKDADCGPLRKCCSLNRCGRRCIWPRF